MDEALEGLYLAQFLLDNQILVTLGAVTDFADELQAPGYHTTDPWAAMPGRWHHGVAC